MARFLSNVQHSCVPCSGFFLVSSAALTVLIAHQHHCFQKKANKATVFTQVMKSFILYYIVSSNILPKRIQQHPIHDGKTKVLSKTSYMRSSIFTLFLSGIIPSFALLIYIKIAYKTMSFNTYIVLI